MLPHRNWYRISVRRCSLQCIGTTPVERPAAVGERADLAARHAVQRREGGAAGALNAAGRGRQVVGGTAAAAAAAARLRIAVKARHLPGRTEGI